MKKSYKVAVMPRTHVHKLEQFASSLGLVTVEAGTS